MFEWVKRHITLIVVMILLLIVGIPVLIHMAFKIDAKFWIFEAEWSAGDFLGYYGAVLSFVGTVVLGVLALYQNQVIKDEADRRTQLVEQREYEASMPKFAVYPKMSNGNCSNLTVNMQNVSENIAMEVEVSNVRILEPNGNVFWGSNRKYSAVVVPAGGGMELKLDNPPLASDGYVFEMRMQCNDKYGGAHKYVIRGIYDMPMHFPKFSVTEIKTDDATK